MRGTRVEKEVEIYATNLANKTKYMQVRILLNFPPVYT
jgi:hypothetical protein